MSLAVRVLLGLLLGLGAGIAISGSGDPRALRLAIALEPLGTAWVNAIRMMVIPLVVALLVSGIAGERTRTVGAIGGRSLLLFAALVACSAAFGAVAGPPLLGLLPLDPATAVALREGLAQPVGESVQLPPFRDWLLELVPSNPVRAAVDGAMLPLIVFVVIAGLALTRIGPERRRPLVELMRGIADASLVVVGWVLALAPFGVFFLVLAMAARVGATLAGALGGFLLVVCALLLVATAALYPLAMLGGGVELRRFAEACAPAQAVGFTSRSSLASLPALLEGADRRLGLPPEVTGLVLPGAVAIFKFGSPIVRLVGTLLVARLYGIALGGAEIGALAAAIGLLSFYSPGIPSGGLFVLAPVYVEFGLPLEGIGLLIALDIVPDMFLTSANVTADMAVAAVVASGVRG